MMGTTVETTCLTRDDVMKKLIIRASDGLVLEVYARIQADRNPWGTQWIGPGEIKTWAELVDAALREGALTIEEGALLLLEKCR